MRRRTTFVRFLALLWGALQLATPGVSALADGQLARDAASGPSTHVEATTRAGCPVVHSPDCAVCRYVSGAAPPATPSALGLQLSAETRRPSAESRAPRAAVKTLPHGRAPPVI